MRNSTVYTKTAKRVLLALGLLFVLSATASAYTLLLRSGRRMEIPERFTVTRTVLTYEPAPGMSVSVQMAAIDIPATERANNESPGSFLKRLQQAETSARAGAGESQLSRAQAQTRNVTNKDLETYARARTEGEAAYEKRRIELGLPTLEESRRRAEREAAVFDELVAKRKQEESERYWRAREAELQGEIDAANARIDSLDYQYLNGANGSILIANNRIGPFDSRFRVGFHRRFPSGFNQGSPCGFNPGISCLQAFPFDFNRDFARRPLVFVTPGGNVVGHRFGGLGGGRVFVSPRR